MIYPINSGAPGIHLFTFQGEEVDNEMKGNGNSINFKYRMHDTRLGRFFAIDPLSFKYPWNSTYAFSENKVIHMIELEGLESTETEDKATSTDTRGMAYGTQTYSSEAGIGDLSGTFLGNSTRDRPQDFNPEIPTSSGSSDIVSSPSLLANTNSQKQTINQGAEGQSVSNVVRAGLFGGDALDETNGWNSMVGALTGGAQYGVNKLKPRQLQRGAYKVQKFLKQKFNYRIQTRTLKDGAKSFLKNASRKITIIGAGAAAVDILIDGEIRPSHALNIVMVGVSAIPGAGWIAGGLFLAADLTSMFLTNKSLGNHLDEAIEKATGAKSLDLHLPWND